MQRQTPVGFGIQMTKLTKTVLIAMFALWVIQTVANPTAWVRSLAWWVGPHFKIWQPFTHWVVYPPGEVFNTLLTWLMIVFFVPPTEESYGQRGVLRITLVIMSMCAIIGTLFSVSGFVQNGPAVGIMPIITAFVTLFGLNRPQATILLFFILPIKAIWIAWGTGLISLMYFLVAIPSGGSLPATLALTAWSTAYGWVQLHDRGGFRKALLRRKQRQLQRKLRRFEVHEGGGEVSKPRGWGHDPNQGDDGPVIH